MDERDPGLKFLLAHPTAWVGLVACASLHITACTVKVGAELLRATARAS